MTRQGPVDFCGMLVGRLVRRTAELLHEGCFSCRWEFEVGLGGMTKMTRRKSCITSREGEALAANVEGTPLPILTRILVPGT